MTEFDRRRPDLAPETVPNHDGSATLRRFRVEAVIYDLDRAGAQRKLEQAGIYLDASRIIGHHEAPEAGQQS